MMPLITTAPRRVCAPFLTALPQSERQPSAGLTEVLA